MSVSTRNSTYVCNETRLQMEMHNLSRRSAFVADKVSHLNRLINAAKMPTEMEIVPTVLAVRDEVRACV